MSSAQGIAIDAARAGACGIAESSTAGGAASSVRWTRANALSLLFLLAIALPIVPSYYEWKHFRQDLDMLDVRPWTLADVPLVWLFYSKTLLVLLPCVALAMLLIWRRWWRAGVGLFLICLAAVFAWVQIDQRVYALTNVHVLSYLDFLGDPAATQWGGNPWDNVADAAWGLKKLFILTSIGIIGILSFAAIARRLLPSLVGGRGACLFAGILAATFIGVAPAQRFFRDPRTLQRAHALLPFDMTWTAVGLNLIDAGEFTAAINERITPALKRSLPTLVAQQIQDTTTRINAGPKPHVILLVVESLREDAMTPAIMPRLTALSHRGVRLSQHYAAARFSHLGMFNLLMGRSSVEYFLFLHETARPQACITLKNSGYETRYLGSADHLAWQRMGRFINSETFDEMSLFHAKSWVTRDQRTLSRLREVLDSAKGKPQFVTAFVAATHFPYVYPDDQELFKPVLPESFRIMRLTPEQAPQLRNRYLNACHYMDSQLGDFLEKLDLTHTLVIVTGDHGESLFDDGAVAHGGRWSDSQLRVPCFLIGAGLEPRTITQPTTHTDLLPTLLHVVAGKSVPLTTITGRDVFDQAPPAFEIVGANSLKDRFELLIRHDDRQMLFSFSMSRYEAQVRGTVDTSGNIDPFDLPPASEGSAWGAGMERVFEQLTGAEKSPIESARSR